MRDVLDGKYTGEMTVEEVIEQYKYRAGIHLSYLELLEKEPNRGWEVYGSKEWHEWAVNGYEWGIYYLQGGKQMEQKKKWYMSKTVWVNLLMAAGIVYQAVMGIQLLGAEEQAAIIVVVNLILRLITGKPLGK